MSVSQADFTQAMMNPDLDVPAGLVDMEGAAAGRRFNVYRNNVAVSLTEAMHTAFPVIAKLLGQQNMDGLSRLYLRAHPPSSPLMMFFGENFPAFIANTTQLDHLGYLADVARLEQAIRTSYHAADAQSIAPDALASLSPDGLMETVFTIAPAVQVIRSAWPIHAIWRFNMEDGAPKPTAIAQDVLVTRPEFDPIPQVLPPGGADLIELLQQGLCLGDALEQVQATHPDFDLGPTLVLLLQGQAISALTTSKG